MLSTGLGSWHTGSHDFRYFQEEGVREEGQTLAGGGENVQIREDMFCIKGEPIWVRKIFRVF